MIYSTLKDYQTFRRRIHMIAYVGLLLRSSKLRPVLHFILMILICFLQIGAVCAFVYYFLEDAKDVSIVAVALAPMCTMITTVVKVGRFNYKSKDVKELDDTLKTLFQLELKHEERRPVLLSLLPRIKKIIHFYVMLYAVSGTAYNIPPVISMIYQHAHHIHPKKYQLTLPAKFPWEIGDAGFRYFLHYLLQLCTLLPLYAINASAEILFMFYAFHVAEVFKIMTHRLQNPKENENRILLLRSCAKKHKLLLRCRDIVEDVYGPIIVNIVLSNCVAMCSLIFQTIQTQLTVKKAFMQLSYFILKFIQINMYAWSGTLMTMESEKFANGVYFSDWIGKSKEMKNDLIITMMQRPLSMKASGFFVVSMDLIPKIINTTLSYYFLLETMNED